MKVWDVTDKKPLKTVELRSVKIDFRPSLVVHRLGKGRDRRSRGCHRGRRWNAPGVESRGARSRAQGLPRGGTRISSLHLYGERGLTAAYARREGTAGLRFLDGPDWGQSLEKSTVSEIPGAGVEGAMPVAWPCLIRPPNRERSALYCLGEARETLLRRTSIASTSESSTKTRSMSKLKASISPTCRSRTTSRPRRSLRSHPRGSGSPSHAGMSMLSGDPDIAKQVTRERRPTQTLKSKGKTFHGSLRRVEKRASHFSWGRARAFLFRLRQGCARRLDLRLGGKGNQTRQRD